MSPSALLWIPLVLSGAVESPSLAALAAASPRPEVCRVARGALDSELWTRVRRERRERFCVALARGYARLERAPAEALALAREARGVLPGEIESRVLEGRALLRTGEIGAAERELRESVLAPGRPLGDLAGLRELGVAHGLSGHAAEAAEVYRVLVPRVDFSKDRYFARIALLEAAASVMASGPSGAHEAALYLTEARRADPVPGFQDLTGALFALALDREGKSDQARVVIEELEGPWSLDRFSKARAPERSGFAEAGPFIPEGEMDAAVALAAFRLDPALSRSRFEAFLERSAAGPWATWGRKWLAELARRARP